MESLRDGDFNQNGKFAVTHKSQQFDPFLSDLVTFGSSSAGAKFGKVAFLSEAKERDCRKRRLGKKAFSLQKLQKCGSPLRWSLKTAILQISTKSRDSLLKRLQSSGRRIISLWKGTITPIPLNF